MSVELLIVFQGVIGRGPKGVGNPAIRQGFQLTASTRSRGAEPLSQGLQRTRDVFVAGREEEDLGGGGENGD